VNKKDMALKLALEAHIALREWINSVPKDTPLPAMPGIDGDWLDEIEFKIREALAEQPAYRAVKTWHDGTPVYVAEQPAQQQEPIVTKNKSGLTLHVGWDDLPVGTKLYTSHHPRKPLTDEEITKVWCASAIYGGMAFARAIEAAHGIKGDA